MKKVLVVAYYFPPIATSGAMRPLGFCRYLEEYGWIPQVLTTEPDSVYPQLPIDEELCTRLPASLRVDRVADVNPVPFLLKLRDFLRSFFFLLFHKNSVKTRVDQKNLHPQASYHRKLQTETATLKDSIFSSLFSFPDWQCYWLRPALRNYAWRPSSERPDLVFATGGPWTGLRVGQKLARRFGVPFIADFRDPWMGNPYRTPLPVFLSTKAKAWERAICTKAAHVITNTDELRQKFIADYPDLSHKFTTITNGFDDKYLDREVSLTTFTNSKSTLELCHFGTIYGKRNPVCLFRALVELSHEQKINARHVRVRFVGVWEPMNGECDALAHQLEREGILCREPPVPHDACLKQMAASQTLLILQPESPLQIPAKIYECIASGRPLFIIGGEGATAHLVEQHRLGRCCFNQVSDIKTLLWQLITGEIGIEPAPPEKQSQFEYRTLTRRLAHIFDSACSTGSVQ